MEMSGRQFDTQVLSSGFGQLYKPLGSIEIIWVSPCVLTVYLSGYLLTLLTYLLFIYLFSRQCQIDGHHI